jgi:hypothetical protein
MGASSERSSAAATTAAAATPMGLDRLRQNQSCYPNDADRETGFHVIAPPAQLDSYQYV